MKTLENLPKDAVAVAAAALFILVVQLAFSQETQGSYQTRMPRADEDRLSYLAPMTDVGIATRRWAHRADDWRS